MLLSDLSWLAFAATGAVLTLISPANGVVAILCWLIGG